VLVCMQQVTQKRYMPQCSAAVAELGWQVERMYAMRRPYPLL
jgi:hypothetical protein